MKKFFYFLILCIAVLAMLLPGCQTAQQSTPVSTSSQPRTETLNWQLHGTLINTEGDASDTLSLSISGHINMNPDKPDSAVLDISFPTDFPYSAVNGNENYRIGEDMFTYCAFNSYFFNTERNDSTFGAFALDLEHQWAVFFFTDKPGQYLVASVDENTDHTDISAHFDAFIKYCDT